jgi:hypothetical protein
MCRLSKGGLAASTGRQEEEIMGTEANFDRRGYCSLVSEYRLAELEQHISSAPQGIFILKAIVVAWASALGLAVVFDLLGMNGGLLAAVLYFSLLIMSVAGVFCLDRRRAGSMRSDQPARPRQNRLDTLRERAAATL